MCKEIQNQLLYSGSAVPSSSHSRRSLSAGKLGDVRELPGQAISGRRHFAEKHEVP